ncbi:MAG: hypothetical protein HQL11_05270 [Candidatus Omnitrophica bacterium]|nr:hypothetical protein [Candidatus Omnitrophota bacterium]
MSARIPGLKVKRFLFELIFWVYAVLYAPMFFLKGKHRDRWGERFGILPDAARTRLSGAQVLWCHAVSAGEMRLAIRLAARFMQQKPDGTVFVTTTTAAGRQVARAEGIAPELVAYAPLDMRRVLQRFLDAVHPSVAVFFETEIWPNTLAELARRRIAAVIANGRISDRAYPRYRCVSWVMKSVLSQVSACLAQSEEHRRRFIGIGAPPERVRVGGNMKFDLEPPEISGRVRSVFESIRSNGRPMVLGASTHPGEEEALLGLLNSGNPGAVNPFLVLAPRHLDRMDSLGRFLQSREWGWGTLSAVAGGAKAPEDVLVVDEWGLLGQIFFLVDVIFVGGSLAPVGGHNIAEAALSGRPVVHGPHMHNFRDMREEFRRADADRESSDAEGVRSQIRVFLENEFLSQQTGTKQKAVVLASRGATDRNIEEILKWWPKKSG